MFQITKWKTTVTKLYWDEIIKKKKWTENLFLLLLLFLFNRLKIIKDFWRYVCVCVCAYERKVTVVYEWKKKHSGWLKIINWFDMMMMILPVVDYYWFSHLAPLATIYLVVVVVVVNISVSKLWEFLRWLYTLTHTHTLIHGYGWIFLKKRWRNFQFFSIPFLNK